MKNITFWFALVTAAITAGSLTAKAGYEHGNGKVSLSCGTGEKDDCVKVDPKKGAPVHKMILEKSGEMKFLKEKIEPVKVQKGTIEFDDSGAPQGFILDEDREFTFADGSKKKLTKGKKVFLNKEMKVKKAE